MEQTLPLRKMALAGTALLGVGLGACAGGPRLAEAPMAAPVSPARAASLRSTGYDAPDVASGAAPSATFGGARIVPASYEAPTAPTAPDAPGPETLSPYFTPESPAEADEAVVPAPRASAYRASARAPLPDLDEIVVTQESAPVRTAQVFEGETRSVMPEREAPKAKPVASTPAARPAPAMQTARATREDEAAALHLASYRQAEQAAAGWGVLKRDHGAVLAGLRPATARVDLPGRGTFIRLIAGPLDPGQAETACAALETQGAYCAVTDWPSDTL